MDVRRSTTRRDLSILISLQVDDQAIARIREVCPQADIRVGPWLNSDGQKMPLELMKGTEVLLCEMPPLNFNDFDQLKWIQLTSAGYSQVLDLPILEKGIRVSNGLGNFDIPVAEWNIMMMLMWHRHMLEMLGNQREKIWDRDAKFQTELRGSIAGFYGYGGIARETARLAKSMGLTVWVMTRDGKVKKRPLKYCVPGTGDPDGLLPDRVFGPAQIEEFLSSVDFLIITMTLTRVTKGIVGEAELRMLKPSAVLINLARAAIIKEEALLKCLREGWIRGAAIDVHYAYPLPPPEHPLWSLPNVILTPHISGSGSSPHFLKRTYDIFLQNLQRYSAGQPLLNELTAAQLQGK